MTIVLSICFSFFATRRRYRRARLAVQAGAQFLVDARQKVAEARELLDVVPCQALYRLGRHRHVRRQAELGLTLTR